MGKIPRLAFLGAGFMARTHAQNATRDGRATVAAIIGQPVETAEEMRAAIGCPDAPVYASFDEFLARGGADALVVAIPPGAHAGEVEAAAAAGLHLFLEKPVALTLERARSMAEAVRRAGVLAQVGYHMRFREPARRLRALLDSGEAGAPTLFQGRFWANFQANPWWRDPAMSGGQMLEQAIHLIDLALFFLGKPVAASGHLANLGHRDQPDYRVEDTGVGLVHFGGGAAATISCSNCALPDRFIGDYRVLATRALLDYRTTGDWRDTDQATLHCAGRTEEILAEGNAHALEMAAFLDALAAGGLSPVPIEAGVESLRVALAIAESSRQRGALVRLDAGA